MTSVILLRKSGWFSPAAFIRIFVILFLCALHLPGGHKLKQFITVRFWLALGQKLSGD